MMKTNYECSRCDRENPIACDVPGCTMPADVCAELYQELREDEALSPPPLSGIEEKILRKDAFTHYALFGVDFDVGFDIPDIDEYDDPADVQNLNNVELLSMIECAPPERRNHIALEDDEWTIIREALIDAVRYAHKTVSLMPKTDPQRVKVNEYINELMAVRTRFYPLEGERRSA